MNPSEFFRTVDISALNTHDPSVIAEARRLGKTIHIYNQGRTRYSFGLYQWSEYRKGVAARWQWHLNVVHGYQYFDLDGREPDTAMICYGKESIYPTIHFERCRQGAEEFYLLNTMDQLADRAQTNPAPNGVVREAKALLRRLEDSVGLNQRTPPGSYDPERIKRQAIALCEALQR